MFDDQMYNTFYQAAVSVLQSNINTTGRQFCDEFLNAHDPRNGMSAQNNAQRFYTAVTNEVMRQTGGTGRIHDNQMLFNIVGRYVSTVFDQWRQSQQNQPMGFQTSVGFNQAPSLFGNQVGGLNPGFSTNRLSASSHLGGSPEESPQPINRPAQVVTPQLKINPTDEPIMSDYTLNPLDSFPDQGLSFSNIEARDCWGDDTVKDRTIIVRSSRDLKPSDPKFIVRLTEAVYRGVVDDQMDVVRKFFKSVTQSYLSKSFIARIDYEHLEYVDIPMHDFTEVRRKLHEVLTATARPSPFWQMALRIIADLKYGTWQILSEYVIREINRALYLNARSVENPSSFIQISELKDLEQLLSATFTHRLTNIPNGRDMIKHIVETAIINAFMSSSEVIDKFTFGVFDDATRDMIQRSPAFPYGMMNIYADKLNILIPEDPGLDRFMDKMYKLILSEQTMIKSRRSVIITNVLGQNVLPCIGKNPSVISGTIPSLLNHYQIDYINPKPLSESKVSDEDRNRKIDRDKLCELDDRDIHYEILGDRRKGLIPVDQTIFAIQYGKDPMDFVMPMDVFTPLDDMNADNNVILAKKYIKTMRVY